MQYSKFRSKTIDVSLALQPDSAGLMLSINKMTEGYKITKIGGAKPPTPEPELRGSVAALDPESAHDLVAHDHRLRELLRARNKGLPPALWSRVAEEELLTRRARLKRPPETPAPRRQGERPQRRRRLFQSPRLA